MIIVNSRAGQRSNRLVVAAHAMAAAIARRETLLFTTFDGYKSDYACETDGAFRVVFRQSRFWELVRLAERFARIIFNFRNFSIPHVLTLASNWNFRSPDALRKNEDAIRRFFAPSNLEEVKRGFDAIPRTGKVLVGVHIRRTDYKTFLGGRYFYDYSVYFREMANVRDFLKSDSKDVLFLVFSDENPEEAVFSDLPCRFVHGRAVEDQWMMSQCDYLMGPPSTFSAWASFMGKVPIARMWSTEYRIKVDDFAYRGLEA